MFEEVQRCLGELGTMTIAVRVHADADGYLDRECPVESCAFEFKVEAEDWYSSIFVDDPVYCPQCRHAAPKDRWNTRAQVEHVYQMAFNALENVIGEALRTDSENFNRAHSGGGFVRMSMTYTGPDKLPVDIPRPSRKC